MKKTILLLLIFLFILTITLSILAYNIVKIDTNEYSHTKAICNENNYCQDYKIICENEEIIRMVPITGAAVQFPEDWQDPRDDETIKKLCE